MCYIPLARKTSAAAKLALYGRTDHAAMLRREPTRIEMKSEDLEESEELDQPEELEEWEKSEESEE